MNSTSFVGMTTNNIIEFLQDEFQGNKLFPKVSFIQGLPASDGSNTPPSRKGLFSFLSGDGATPLHLTPYSVQRAKEGRATTRTEHTSPARNDRTAVVTKNPESYLIKYLIVGPSVVSEEGQRVLSALISILFDRQSLKLIIDGSEEEIRLLEPVTQSDSLASDLLREHQIARAPLYTFYAQVQIESGRQLAADSYVKTRNLSVSTTQQPLGGSL